MSGSSAMHRTMVLVDVAGFTRPERTLAHHKAVRAGLYKVLKEAFAESRVTWAACHHEDRGDGVMILVPADVPAIVLADQLLERIVAALREHNAIHSREASIQLRVVLHSGQVWLDDTGGAGAALNFAFRLLAAPVAKQRLRESSGVLAVVASEGFYRDVISQKPSAAPDTYRRIRAEFDGFSSDAWLRLFGQPDHAEVRSQFSAGEMDQVRDWLSAVTVVSFADIARRASGMVLPLPWSDNPWQAFEWLADVNAGQDGVPPALVFLDAMATAAGGELGGRIAAWVGAKVRDMRIERVFEEKRRTLFRAVGEPRLHLVISFEHDGIDPHRYVLSAWRQDDPEVWAPIRSDIREIHCDDMERVTDDVVVAAEWAWADQRSSVTLEMLLPRELLQLPVHNWCKERDSGQPRPLCLDYVIHVRSLDRMKSRHWYRTWRERWQSLRKDPSPDRIHFAAEDGEERVDLLLRVQDSIAIVLNEPPSSPDDPATDEFTVALRTGLPVMLWHPEATPEELRELVMWLVARRGGLLDLPERSTELRRAALGVSALPVGRKLARDLVVLWDDPDRTVVLDHPSDLPW